VQALAKADGLRTLVHACSPAAAPAAAAPALLADDADPSPEDSDEPHEEDEGEGEGEDEDEMVPLTEEEVAAESAADARMVLDVLRMGASTALCGGAALRRLIEVAGPAQSTNGSTGDDELLAVVDDLLVESGLLALARSTLLPPLDPDAAAERSAGKGKLSDALLATLALRATVCMAAILEAKPGMELSLSPPASPDATTAVADPHHNQPPPSGEATAGLVLDGALAHADLSLEHCHPVLDAAWLLLRRLSENGEEGSGWAARATISRVAAPHAVRTGSMSIAAGEVQARALHCLHWMWYDGTADDDATQPGSAGAGGSSGGGIGWGWADDEQVSRLVPPVLRLLEGGGGSGGGGSAVGQQQDEACRLANLLLGEGPPFLRCMLLEEIGCGGGMLRLRELMDDGTPAMSWSKAYAAAALQTAQRLCAPVSRLPAEEQLALGMQQQQQQLLPGGNKAASLGRSGVAMLSNVGSAAVNFIERKTGVDLDGDGDVGVEAEDSRDEILRRQQPVLEGLAVATRAGLLMELQPAAIGAALFPTAPRPKSDTRSDRQVAIQEREDGMEEPSLLALVLSPLTDTARLDRQLLDCMVEMAYWRRRGEDVLAPKCVLGVLGLDGRGVGSQGAGSEGGGGGRGGGGGSGVSAVAAAAARTSADVVRSWKALDLRPEELPALVLIKERQVIERQTYGQVDPRGGVCSRGGEAAVSTALPPLTKEILQPAVELMLRAAH
jgi:uncharacterized membrane protein YgcG